MKVLNKLLRILIDLLYNIEVRILKQTIVTVTLSPATPKNSTLIQLGIEENSSTIQLQQSPRDETPALSSSC